MFRSLALFLLITAVCVSGFAQDENPSPGVEVSGQFNSVTQGNFNFHSPYAGTNSLPGTHQVASSRVMTLFTKIVLPAHTDFEVDIESAGGSGIGQALGLAAFTNLDVVRNPSLGSAPYLARALVHHTFALTGSHPDQRIEFYAGQFSTVDWFDVNSVGSDSHTQFLNWAIDNNGAYDYAADTRGYTRGVVLQWSSKNWALRTAEMMLPTVANGLVLTWSGQTHSENIELQRRTSLLRKPGVVRLLTFVNHANMGDYREAIAASGPNDSPDISLHSHPGTVKYGFGVNTEQQISSAVRIFARWGWNEGRHESFVYTESNSSVAVGADVRYAKKFKSGLAMATDGISADHRAYLAAGGMGFILGDGRLNYGRETVVETYTEYSFGRGVSATLDLQYVQNPGYNRDRGPVWVPGFRLHWDVPSYRKAFRKSADTNQ